MNADRLRDTQKFVKNHCGYDGRAGVLKGGDPFAPALKRDLRHERFLPRFASLVEERAILVRCNLGVLRSWRSPRTNEDSKDLSEQGNRRGRRSHNGERQILRMRSICVPTLQTKENYVEKFNPDPV